MKIAILVALFPPKWLAGIEIATYNLAEHLTKRGHEIHIITTHVEGLPHVQMENGFYIHQLSWPKIRIFGVLLFWLNIFFTVRKITPDIVHAQSLGLGIPAYLSKKLLRIPYIVWGQGSDVYLPGSFIRITSRLILQNADAILALTEDMRKKMTEITSREIYVIPNGINLEQFYDRSQNLIKNEGTKIILFVGRLHPVKGVQYLLMAMKNVHEEMPDARLILVGDGTERERLELLSIQLGIQNYVQFVGRVPHKMVLTFMQKADVFVLPSLSEGLPNVIIEAMACGLPVVATRVGGIPDIIVDGVNGSLVEVKRQDEISEKLLFLLRDKQLYWKISKNNKETVKKYSWDNIISHLEKIYYSL